MVQKKEKTKACYCAFCRSERDFPPKRHVGFLNLGGTLIASLLTMWLAWQEFDGRVLLIFVVFLAFAECFIQLRWRLSLPCKYCGFDPALYVRKPEDAAERVQRHLKMRQNNPLTLFSARPNLDLPLRRVPAHILSKTI